MNRLISHVSLLSNIQLVHMFSNTFETARYNMIIHVIVFFFFFFFFFFSLFLLFSLAARPY